jgi:oxalate decarboxylase
MDEPTRRDVLGTGIAAAGGLLMGAGAMGHAAQEAAKAKGELPAFRFAMEAQEPRTGEGGTAREASATQFPVSTGIAGVSMTLEPGTMRELHWHANAAEWAYVVSGSCRTTIYGPDGATEANDFAPGDVWYFPRGHGHSIQATGRETCHFILVFDNGYFSEFATFSFSDWIGHTPVEVLEKNLKLPKATIEKLPKKEVYFARGPVPGPLKQSRAVGRLTHHYALGAQPPRKFHGGDLRLVTVKEFPISTTMCGATMTLERGALRDLHWHPNADEWQYVLEGQMRMTVFASSGLASTVDFNRGDVGYVPRGYGHYLENVGQQPCRVLLVFNAGVYEDIGLSGWIASNPRQLVATNLKVDEQLLSNLPPRGAFISQ